MTYTIKRIYDDDYGCEERDESAPVMVLLELVNDNGETLWQRLPEA